MEKPATSEHQKTTIPHNDPGPSSAPIATTSQQHGTPTPIEDNEPASLVANSSINIWPITTRTRPSEIPKKLNRKKSARLVPERKRTSIRNKATVSAARKTANTKLTKAKIAALKQCRILNTSQSLINLNELQRKKTTRRIFQEHFPGHTKPFTIAAYSAANFMMTTPSRNTVSTIVKLPHCATNANHKQKLQ